MQWAERWRIARVLYREICFQSIFALKSGNPYLKEIRETDPGARAEKRILQSKLTVSVLFGITSLFAAGTVTYGRDYIQTSLSPLYFDTAVIALSLVVVFSLVWITGLQVALPFLTSQALTSLRTTPIADRDLDGIAALAFLHLFDLPLATGLVVFPISIFLALDSWTAVLLAVPAVLSIEIFALSLSLLTAVFFARAVSGSSGGSLGNLVLRWVYLILWTIPSLAITVFIVFSVQILGTLGQWADAYPALLGTLFVIFPFPFSWAIAESALHTRIPWGYATLWLTALGAYTALMGFSGRWLLTAPMRLGRTVATVSETRSGRLPLVPRHPVLAIVTKDLRIASRTPAYAFILLLPLLDALVLGLFTYLGTPNPAKAGQFASAAVTVAVLLSTFFGPVFFATEVMGFSLTRTLPITQRTLILGKTLLIVSVYVIAFLLVAVLVASRVSNFPLFLLFALAELPAIVAAAFLEIGMLVWRAEKTGVPLTSLYSGAWWVTAVSVPGIAVAGTPLVLFHFVPSIPWMALAAAALFCPIALVSLRGRDKAL